MTRRDIPFGDDDFKAEMAEKENALATHKHDLERLQHKIDTLQIEIRAFQRAADLLRPKLLNGTKPPVSVSPKPEEPAKRGKAKGDISKVWRAVMAKVALAGNMPLSPDLWAVLSAECGRLVNVDAVRNWLRHGAAAENGYIVRTGDMYRLSDKAVQKFNLMVPDPPTGQGETPASFGGS